MPGNEIGGPRSSDPELLPLLLHPPLIGHRHDSAAGSQRLGPAVHVRVPLREVPLRAATMLDAPMPHLGFRV